MKFSTYVINMASVQNYLGTLIFSIILLVLCVVAIALLMLNIIPKQISFLVITLIIGFIIITTIALYSIVKYDKKKRDERNNLTKSRMDIVMCPDFYTRSNNDICLNEYVTGDGTTLYSIQQGSNIDLTKYLNKPIEDVCKAYTQDAYRNGVYLPNSNVIPWTYLSSKCDVL